MCVRGQLLRVGQPLHGPPVLLVADGERRLAALPEGLLQGVRAEHHDLQDAALQRPDRGVLPRPPVQHEQHRAAARQRYGSMCSDSTSTSATALGGAVVIVD